MEQLLEQFYPFITVFLLIFARISAFFVTVPIFSYRSIPVVPRLFIALGLAAAMTSVFVVPENPLIINGMYVLLVIKEVIVGLLLGMIAFMIMSAIQIAGGFVDFQMGFAIANVIDPQTGAQSPLLGQFFNVLTMLLLLALDGHHLILDGIYYSYQFLPIDQLALHVEDGRMVQFIIQTFTITFAIAFQMAVPVVATLFLVDLALGITARTVPQLNIFVVGFPIKIGVSFLVLSSMAVVLLTLVKKLFELMAVSMRDLMLILGGG